MIFYLFPPVIFITSLQVATQYSRMYMSKFLAKPFLFLLFTKSVCTTSAVLN